MPAVLPHNEKSGATWGSGGAEYDLISEAIADSTEHLLNRLGVRPGERALDLATGTGWTARRLAQKGAKVTALDIGEGVVEAAKRLARQTNLDIEFAVGDAEGTDLPSGAFDVIASTCGVMFASRPEAVARELARLCRPGGRIGLTTWPPTSTLAQMFQMMRPYMPPPPGPAPPRRRPSSGAGPSASRSFWAATSTYASRRGRRCCGCLRASTSGMCSARATARRRCCTGPPTGRTTSAATSLPSTTRTGRNTASPCRATTSW